MMYQAFQYFADMTQPMRALAGFSEGAIKHWFPNDSIPSVQKLIAMYEQVELMGFTHHRTPFNIQSIKYSDGSLIPIEEEIVSTSEFCHLVRFKKVGHIAQPKVLLVAPMSGHFATLLAGTARTLLKDHDVYITDWINIRDIPLGAGMFDFDSYVEHIIHFLEILGPDSHLMGVCQPTVACLIATAVMSEDRSPYVPASVTLMAGPIDVRSNPTKVNDLANEKPLDWFSTQLISSVPTQFKGAGRKVYPGFIQISAFMNMNAKRHQESFRKLYEYRVKGENDKANAIRNFYQEYFAIMDLSAPFYLETIQKVFQDCELPLGKMCFRGRLINLRAIRKPFLLTVEGQRDDICGIGQTLAAQDLCGLLPSYKKAHHLQPGVGHYGVFNGSRWENQIYPVVRNLIQSSI